MEVKAYFDDIAREIIGQLQKAEREILVAVAWFTDREIFRVLCHAAQRGLTVAVALADDEINRGPGGLVSENLTDIGGKVHWISQISGVDSLMHHKFCVIDGSVVITGSYNWSRKARENAENVTIIKDAPDLAGQFKTAFNEIIGADQQAQVSGPADREATRRRLELIRSLITLNEIRSVPEQVAKLRPVSSELKLSLLLNALESGQFTEALAQIEEYLVRSTALTRAGETEIPQLRLRLTGLELRLEALNNEKAELDRRLLIFGRHHDETLGDLIQEVLQARAELAGLRASQAQKGDASKAQEEADEANRKYSEYSEHRQSILENEPPPVLDKKSEKELKRAYRQACQLCHPDKVQEEYKERAQATFVELQNAYRLNDLAKVKEILETLQGGAFPAFRSALLRTFDALKSAIAEIEYKIGAVVNDIVLLRESNSYQLMIKFGSSAERWRAYVKDQRVLLSDELNELRASIAAEDE